ncbi:hypothetical protein CEP51_014772 [Fusarium floridanum]|uniref:Uncharacterized protein n=1 Tax=Fusarium floridanum TaxID=1325733 RepID=A0A428PM40_9HYPO|nr:hypothetical protein CEP51_014772 [Fusarium floridanum]
MAGAKTPGRVCRKPVGRGGRCRHCANGKKKCERASDYFAPGSDYVLAALRLHREAQEWISGKYKRAASAFYLEDRRAGPVRRSVSVSPAPSVMSGRGSSSEDIARQLSLLTRQVAALASANGVSVPVLGGEEDEGGTTD